MVNFSVEVYDDEHFERALRRFSVKTKKTGLMRDLKRKRFYTKPSVQKKIDRQKSIRRQKKAERLAELAAGGKDLRRASTVVQLRFKAWDEAAARAPASIVLKE